MIRATVVALSENGLPRTTLRVFYSQGHGAEEILRRIEEVLGRRNRTAALSDLITTIRGVLELPDVAGTLEILRGLHRSFEHLGATVEQPVDERPKGDVLIRSFSIRFGVSRRPSDGHFIPIVPSWARADRQDPWGNA